MRRLVSSSLVVAVALLLARESSVVVTTAAPATAGPGATGQSGQSAAVASPSPDDLAARVTIRRDTFGVPHVLAEDEEAAAFGLGYAQAEDHAAEMGERYILARGDAARWFGRRYIDNDLAMKRAGNLEAAREALAQAGEGYRRWLRGFVAGVNAYVAEHRAELPAWMPLVTEADILAHGRAGAVQAVMRPRTPQPPRTPQTSTDNPTVSARAGIDPQASEAPVTPKAPDTPETAEAAETLAAAETPEMAAERLGDIGSNALALAGSRTTSGRPILLANPHLRWSSLYWEAQITVPGRINFYGSTLVGLAVLRAGFSDTLAYAQTNNAPALEDVFAVPLDPRSREHYRWNGQSLAFQQRRVTIDVLQPDGRIEEQSQVFLATEVGPVAQLTDTHALIVRSESFNSWGYHEGFYDLLFARDLASFQQILGRQLIPTSNFTYADIEGNILYQWNARLPRRAAGYMDHKGVLPAADSRFFGQGIHPLDELPRLLNPSGGYIQNANNAPWFTSLRDRLDPARYPPYTERRPLALRPQVALLELDRDRKFSVDDVLALKFNTKVLLAERVLPDLLAAAPGGDVATGSAAAGGAAAGNAPAVNASAGAASADLQEGLRVLRAWDRHVSRDSRGAVLFMAFWNLYERGRPQPFREPWDEARPVATPAGLADPKAALEALAKAVGTVRARHKGVDVAWGEVNRFRFGDRDLPGDGASGTYGLYRVLSFDDMGDGTSVAGRPGGGKPIAGTGDGWVMLVHFTRPVTAMSVLAYGQTSAPGSPHNADQIQLFADHKLRPVWFTEQDIRAHLEREYRPGREASAFERTDAYVMSDPGVRIFVREVLHDRKKDAPLPTAGAASAAPVLLVHGGGPGGLASFDMRVPGYSVAEDVARAGHPVYVMNVRGWEQSSRPLALEQPGDGQPPAVTLDETLRDIDAVVTWIRHRNGGARVALVGWASGGHWAGAYAAAHGARVSHLVLLNAMYGVSAPWALSESCAGDALAKPAAYRLAAASALLGRWDSAIPADARRTWRDAAVADAYVEAAIAADPTSGSRSPASARVPYGYFAQACALAAGRTLYDASAITVPTLVVRGERDFWSRPEDLATLERTLGSRARSRFVTIPGATHHLLFDRPEHGRRQFMDATFDWLRRRHDGASAP